MVFWNIMKRIQLSAIILSFVCTLLPCPVFAQKSSDGEGGDDDSSQQQKAKPKVSPGTHMVIILSPEEYWKDLAKFSYKTLKSLIGQEAVFALQLTDDAADPPVDEYKAINGKAYKKGVKLFKEQEYPDAIKQLSAATKGFEALIIKYGLSYPLRRRVVLSYMYLGAAQMLDAQTEEAKASFRFANYWFPNYPLPKAAFEDETTRNLFNQAIERPGRGSSSIIINSSVPGHLYLNGMWVGAGPKNIDKISAGTHVLTWARLGYKPITVKLIVPENDKAVADFAPVPTADKKDIDTFLSGLDTHLRQKPNVPSTLADFAVKARVDNLIVFRTTANETEISWYNSKSGGWQKRVRRQAAVPGSIATQVETLLFEPSPVMDLGSDSADKNKCFADSDCVAGKCVAGTCQSTTPLLKQWWFWTALGVGVAALGTGTYFLIQMQNRPILEMSTP
ncbi:MAG: hypothetical protein CVU65_12595 [Deltaproteobacteria bacterium HGW-Deltaproteobacteria-22]|jgi:hypothetical protein|nr:MAG: hypothetical protein CVU65_12595 [Deltaproteobacteria bacterium HGW-Deltaproteobacteria-22]